MVHRVKSPTIAEWLEVTLVTSTILRTLAVGQRKWIPSCLVNFQISRETDGIGDTSIRCFVTGLSSSTTKAEEWLDQAANSLVELWKRPGSQRDGQSVVLEFGHGLQERGSGFGENIDSQAWL